MRFHRYGKYEFRDTGRKRAAFARKQKAERGALLAYWQGCKWPADPSYFLSMLHMYDTGRLSLDIPKA